MRKLLFVVLDGLGDLPSPELRGKTPLESAETPHMDSLAKRGKTGLMYPIRRGVAPESDTAIMSILGYDPYRYHTGRGPLEAFGAGLTVNDGDLALRCNFATIRGKEVIIDRRAGRDLKTSEGAQLARAVNTKVRLTSTPADFIFNNTVGYRGALVIRRKDGRLSGKITNMDPAYLRVGRLTLAKTDIRIRLGKCLPEDRSEEAKYAAALTNEFVQKSRKVLEKHELNLRRRAEGRLPANFILPRNAGDRLPKLPKLEELYGAKFGFLVEMPVERGVSLLCGMKEIEWPAPTGDLRIDFSSIARKAFDAIGGLEAVYVHIKHTDEPGHDGDHRKKKRIIELIDENLINNLVSGVDTKECLIAVTGDHSTPCSLRAHTDHPVPLLISGGGVEPDKVREFSESDCRRGSIGTIVGRELMPMLMKLVKIQIQNDD